VAVSEGPLAYMARSHLCLIAAVLAATNAGTASAQRSNIYFGASARHLVQAPAPGPGGAKPPTSVPSTGKYTGYVTPTPDLGGGSSDNPTELPAGAALRDVAHRCAAGQADGMRSPAFKRAVRRPAPVSLQVLRFTRCVLDHSWNARRIGSRVPARAVRLGRGGAACQSRARVWGLRR
jgi:hypothetical protein